jgi:hypothetical protein
MEKYFKFPFHFFPRLLKTFKHFDFTLRKDSFKTQVNLFLSENIKIFLNKFPKFDIKFSAYYREKKKNLSKAKKARAKWGNLFKNFKTTFNLFIFQILFQTVYYLFLNLFFFYPVCSTINGNVRHRKAFGT